MKHCIKLLLAGTIALYSFGCNSHSGTASKKTLHTAFGNIKFDQSITGFKQADIVGGEKFVYSANGQDDLSNKKSASGFYLQPLPGVDFNAAKSNQQVMAETWRLEAGKENISDESLTIYDTPYGKAALTVLTVKKPGGKTITITGAISNGKNTILFVARDSNNGDYAEGFKGTFNSLEL